MNQELDKKLVEKYPAIFANRYSSPQDSAMSWGFDCGDGWFNIIDQLCSNITGHIESIIRANEWLEKELRNRERAANGDWGFLYEGHREDSYYLKWLEKEENLQNEKQRYINPLNINFQEVPHVVADQVKEKFGTLSFYYSGGDEYIRGMVRMATSMSSRICEECGSLGRTRSSGWIRTLCDRHAEEFNYGVNDDYE